MNPFRQVQVAPRSLQRFEPLVGAERLAEAARAAQALQEQLSGRVIWNLNSTAVGGGVAEMLRSLLAYARGAGADIRWRVFEAPPEFFRVTKRLHNALHGYDGDGLPLDAHARELYERVLATGAGEFSEFVRRRDVVILHDPQTAGLIPRLAHMGARIIWRCHVGSDKANAQSERAWAFLDPYLQAADSLVFTRSAYVPPHLSERSAIIRPSIDPFSAKNQELDDATVRAILVHVGLIEGPAGPVAPSFTAEDGSPGRVDHCADVMRLGRASAPETPLVVQVSRWDRLKDPVGVMRGFAQLIDRTGANGAELVLAGPNVHAVADDPEGAEVFDEVASAWRSLPHGERRRVHLASLPSKDVQENGIIVNALQRHATIVVQKSLREGFGLTVAEAMWKRRAVVASGVGGILDQIEDGVHGLLLSDPCDLEAFGEALDRLIESPALCAEMGRNGRERVRKEYLALRSLFEYAELIQSLEH
jgi:trehalose synthase